MTLRDRLLDAIRDGGCEHTGDLARDFDVAPSTARYWLDKLEAEGLIEGVRVDERDTLPNGRRRMYWSPVEANKPSRGGS